MRAKSAFEQLCRRTVTVHLKTDQSFRGILVETYSDCLVLDLPVLLGDQEQQDEPLGGQAVFPLDNIDYFQTEKFAWRPS